MEPSTKLVFYFIIFFIFVYYIFMYFTVISTCSKLNYKKLEKL